jgi:hypothetical protein
MFRLDEDEANALVVRKVEAQPKGRPKKIDRAENLLREWLQDGGALVANLKELAKVSGIGWRTFEEVKKQLDVTVSKKGQSSYWKL